VEGLRGGVPPGKKIWGTISAQEALGRELRKGNRKYLTCKKANVFAEQLGP